MKVLKRFVCFKTGVIMMALFLVAVGVVPVQAANYRTTDTHSNYITVDGKKMHTVFYGEIDSQTGKFVDTQKTTIVMLPALAVPSPNVYFKPIAENIMSNFNVVVIEPFGYGLSDTTNRERTVNNINSEINEALNVLEIDKCVLLVHSISGVYGLQFVYQYPEKVKGFIAIDNSIYDEDLMEEMKMEQAYMLQGAKEFEDLRNTFSSVQDFQKAITADPEKYEASLPEIKGYSYTEQDKEEYIKAYAHSSNQTVMNEINCMIDSLKTIQSLKFPSNLPVLTMISSDNVAVMPAWETAHKDQLDPVTGKHEMYVLDGSHYIWYRNLNGVVEHINNWGKKNNF